MNDELELPKFLKISAKDRAKAWSKKPLIQEALKTAIVKPKKAEDIPELRDLVEEEKRRKEIKAKNKKIGRDRGTERLPGSTWDTRRGMWVHPVLEKQAAAKAGKTTTIEIVDPEPRAAGTKAATRFAEMKAYVDKHPGASLADVLRNTSYTRIDYDWDKTRGSIK
jgi:hypothetical protein